jgi:hypothetical protein
MRYWRQVAIFAAVLFAGLPAIKACPGCNIFNYLYTSIRSSPNIVVGTVEQQIDERTALVRVDRTMRGTNQPKTTAKFELYNASNHIGRQFIFSDPTECCPDFPALPVDGEWEVSFLVRNAPFDEKEPFGFYDLGGPEEAINQTPKRGRPVVKNSQEAVLCVMGVSYVTRELGIQYARVHSKQTLPLLREELSKWVADFSQYETNSIAYHRLDGLIEGVWKTDAAAARKLFAEDLTERLARKPEEIRINDNSRNATLEASFVKSVLKHAQDAGDGEIFKRQVLKAVPNLRNQTLVVTIYALIDSDLATPSKVEDVAKGLLSENPEQQLSLALGYYQVGVEHARWWAMGKAREELMLARVHCSKANNAQLASQIDEEIERANRWSKK